MTRVLNEYDKALHDAIHEDMLKSEPTRLLLNPRAEVLKVVHNVIGAPYGNVVDIRFGSRYLDMFS